MKVLYFTARPPYPVTKGDQSIAYNQIKELSKNHEVYLLTYCDKNKDILVVEMKKYCKEIHILYNSSLSKVLTAMKTFVNFKPFQVNMFYKKCNVSKVKEVYNKIDPDVVHVQSFRVAEYFLYNNINKSIDLIDAYSLNMKYRKNTSRSLLKILWNIEHKLLNRYEKKLIREFNKKTIVAKRDKEYLGDNSIVVNPLGVNLDRELIKRYKRKKDGNYINIVFQGNMSYYANINAVNYLVNEILPNLKDYKVKVYLVGGHVSREVHKLSGENVVVTGYVKHIEEYLAIADMVMYPIFIATGMQSKILEALYAGIPCITTSVCLKGSGDFIDSENILVANTVNEFILRFKEVINKKEMINNIILNGIKLVEEKYTWTRNVENLIKLWENK